jgi:hypothetical protein
MAGALEDLAKTLDLQPADILSAFTGLRAAVPIYMGLGATGLNAGEDEQLRRIYGPLPPTPVSRETPEMAQRRMVEEFEQRFPTPELRRAVIEQMRANRREGRFDPSTATRRADFAPHAQPEYKGPVATPSIGKRKFQAGGKVVKSAMQKARDVAAAELWHGGNYRRGETINRPLYMTPIREMAESYVDVKGVPDATLQQLKPQVSRPAPERLVRAASRRYVPDNERLGYTPASAFDENLHDPEQIAEMIRELQRRGYDSAVARDVGMRQGMFFGAPVGDALVVFPGNKAYQAGGRVKKTAQQMADEMLVRGTKTAQREPVNLSRRGFFGLPESKSMPLAKIDDTTLDKLEKKYAREGQAPALTERTTTVSPDAGKTQSTLRSIVETPMSRRSLLQAAGSQAVQSMLPAGALPVPSVSNLVKPVVQAATAAPSPLSMMGAIAKAVEAGLSERQAVAAVRSMFPKADRYEIEDSFQMLSDPYVNSTIEPGDLQRPVETMRNLIAPNLPSDASPFALRSAMREVKREAPLTYSGAKGFAKDVWDDEIETLFERGYIKSDDELRRLRMGDESIYDLMYDRGR